MLVSCDGYYRLGARFARASCGDHYRFGARFARSVVYYPPLGDRIGSTAHMFSELRLWDRLRESLLIQECRSYNSMPQVNCIPRLLKNV